MFCQPGFEAFQTALPDSSYNYLEIGVFNGDSIAQLASENPGKTMYGIDPFIEDGFTTEHTQKLQGQSIDTQRAATYNEIKDLTNVVLFEVTSQAFANILTDEMVTDMNIAWVLIDGSHNADDVSIDVDLAMRLIGTKKGGIVMDDLNLKGPRKGFEKLQLEYSDQISLIQDIYPSHRDHMALITIN